MDTERYKQIKVSVDAAIAEKFKQACGASSTSMASVLSQFMAEYASTSMSRKQAPDYSTRRRRRAAIQVIGGQLEQIKAYEERYRDNIPDNLQGSMVYERADELVSLLDDVLDLLGSV